MKPYQKSKHKFFSFSKYWLQKFGAKLQNFVILLSLGNTGVTQMNMLKYYRLFSKKYGRKLESSKQVEMTMTFELWLT